MIGFVSRGARPPALSIIWSEGSDATELSLHGELDLEGTGRFADASARAIRSGRRCLVIDVGPLTFVDMIGVRALLTARDDCVARGVEFRVRGVPSPQVIRALWRSHTSDRLLDVPHGQPIARSDGAFSPPSAVDEVSCNLDVRPTRT